MCPARRWSLFTQIPDSLANCGLATHSALWRCILHTGATFLDIPYPLLYNICTSTLGFQDRGKVGSQWRPLLYKQRKGTRPDPEDAPHSSHLSFAFLTITLPSLAVVSLLPVMPPYQNRSQKFAWLFFLINSQRWQTSLLWFWIQRRDLYVVGALRVQEINSFQKLQYGRVPLSLRVWGCCCSELDRQTDRQWVSFHPNAHNSIWQKPGARNSSPIWVAGPNYSNHLPLPPRLCPGRKLEPEVDSNIGTQIWTTGIQLET